MSAMNIDPAKARVRLDQYDQRITECEVIEQYLEDALDDAQRETIAARTDRARLVAALAEHGVAL